MARQRPRSRRSYLAATGATIAALAGCTGGGGGDGSDGDGDGGDGGGDSSDGGDDGGDGGGGANTATPEPVTISMATTQTGSLGVLTAIVAGEGLDKAHGINLEFQGAVPPKAMQLLRNKAVTVSIFSPQGAAIANTQGSNIRLFGPNLANHISLMTATDDGGNIQGWDDIVGESVGIMGPPTGMWNHTRLFLAEAGHSMDDFDFRKGSPGAIHAFDEKGDVAAHAHFIPVTIKAIESGGFREVLFYPDRFEEVFGHNLQFVPLAAHQSWLDENPETAKKVRAAMIDAQKLFKEKPKETISSYMDTIGLENEAQVDLAVERMPAIYPAKWTSTEKENVVSQLDLSQKHGIIPSEAPTDIVADL